MANEIAYDLSQHEPMMRLVQGDVGAGKTVVAATAALQAWRPATVALMAPTEILAEQHYITFKRWLEPLGIEVARLAGKLKGKARAAAWSRSPTVHRWWSAPTRCSRRGEVQAPALAIIDEQHRFGVQQRLALRKKGVAGELCPHQLIMTATPIPRTTAMSAYADWTPRCSTNCRPGAPR